jgi:hypothetical protein
MEKFMQARFMIDFDLIPSIVLSDDFEDFITAVIVSEGEVLADIFNEVFDSEVPEKELHFTKAFSSIVRIFSGIYTIERFSQP